MSKIAFKVELENENPFTNGYFYESLPLPATNFQIRDAMHKVRVRSGMLAPNQISVYDCRTIPQLEGARLDSPTLDELNFLAKRLVALDENEVAVMKALVPKYIMADEDELVSLKDLINMTYGLQNVSVLSNVGNDIDLGEFVIETGMQGDVASVPDNATYLLDKAQIGRLQRQMDGGVFVGNLYVCTDHFEMPKVYDGITLPESEPEQWYAFRLLVAEAPKGNETNYNSAEWISLPMQQKQMQEVAARHNANSLGDLVYYDFESSIPQITSEDFASMHDIDMLNDLAKRMAEMSPDEQITFKAAIESSRDHGINFDDIFNIAHNLYKYEMSTVSDTSDNFFKEYLLTHMDSKFDARWLDTVPCTREGNRLLSKLGATLTDYGVISSWGGSLYKLVPFDQEQSDQSETPTEDQEEGQGMTLNM